MNKYTQMQYLHVQVCIYVYNIMQMTEYLRTYICIFNYVTHLSLH